MNQTELKNKLLESRSPVVWDQRAEIHFAYVDDVVVGMIIPGWRGKEILIQCDYAMEITRLYTGEIEGARQAFEDGLAYVRALHARSPLKKIVDDIVVNLLRAELQMKSLPEVVNKALMEYAISQIQNIRTNLIEPLVKEETKYV